MRARAYTHTHRSMRTTTEGPLLSNNHHTEKNQGVPLLKPHPFLTRHITENCFGPNPKPVGVVWLRERLVSWGESQLQVRGHAERKRQPKVSQDEKLAFQMAAKDQTSQRNSGCVSDAPTEEFQKPFLFSSSFLSCLPRGNHPRNSKNRTAGQGGARSKTGQKTGV